METFIGVLVGGLITLVVSLWFYKKAAGQLKDESQELRRLSKLVLRGLEEGKLIRLSRDADGDITGLSFTIDGGIELQSKAAGDQTVTRR